MGNPLSSFIAEQFMINLEEKIKNEDWFPRFWQRYVDDTCCIIKKDKVALVLEKLNKVHPNIEFTYEIEKDNHLPFLDLLIKRNTDNTISFGIFHKQTSSNQIIHNTSHHPVAHKHAAFHSFFHRLCTFPLSQDEHIKEYNHIMKIAKTHGYETENILKIYNKHKKKSYIKKHTTLMNVKETTQNMYLSLPFHPNITNKLKPILTKHKLTIAYSNKGKLRDILGSTKSKRENEDKSGIYKLSCTDCPSIYIGRTKRKIKERKKEHLDNIRKNEQDLSAMAKHCIENYHYIKDQVLLDAVDQPWNLKTYELFHINKNNNDDLVNIEKNELHFSPLFKFIM